jgi:hypothetical protein
VSSVLLQFFFRYAAKGGVKVGEELKNCLVSKSCHRVTLVGEKDWRYCCDEEVAKCDVAIVKEDELFFLDFVLAVHLCDLRVGCWGDMGRDCWGCRRWVKRFFADVACDVVGSIEC